MKLKTSLAAITAAFALSGAALAGPVLSDLTTADYITVGALDWAWAGPIASEDWFGVNTLYQAGLHAGWREATDVEWATVPLEAAFGGKCASKYWNSVFTHCDRGNPFAQHWEAGATGNAFEMIYVRDADGVVPEPASLALVGLALLAAGGLRRRKPA